MSPKSGTGTVYLVGAGPGAADLLTLRAARLLAEADVVFHDALVPREILEHIKTARLVPVGKRCGRHATAQRFINQRIYEAAREHRIVVRLKGGDPMLFGRAQEEIAFLRRQGIPVEVVPGVTAAVAAGAALQVSLTQRGVARSVAFVTPRVGEGERASGWARAAAAADTVALYMASGEAEEVLQALLAEGKAPSTPIAVAESISRPEQSLHAGTLAELPRLAARCSGGPALVLLGGVFADAADQATAGCGRFPRSASQAA